MDVQKIPKRPPFYIFRHYATYRKLFSQFLVFWELLLSPVVEKVVFVFESFWALDMAPIWSVPGLFSSILLLFPSEKPMRLICKIHWYWTKLLWDDLILWKGFTWNVLAVSNVQISSSLFRKFSVCAISFSLGWVTVALPEIFLIWDIEIKSCRYQIHISQ